MSASTTKVAIVPDDGDFADWLRCAREQGFTHVEIGGCERRADGEREALAESGLFVLAVRLGVGMGEEGVAIRRDLLERQKRMVIDAAQLGASVAVLTRPSAESKVARACFLEGRELLTAFAVKRGVRVVVEGAGVGYERVPLSSDAAM